MARNNADWYRLLDLCGVTDTLIGDEDGVYHPGLFNDRRLATLSVTTHGGITTYAHSGPADGHYPRLGGMHRELLGVPREHPSRGAGWQNPRTLGIGSPIPSEGCRSSGLVSEYVHRGCLQSLFCRRGDALSGGRPVRATS